MLQPTNPIQGIIQYFVLVWDIWWPLILRILELGLLWFILIVIAGFLTKYIRRRAMRVGIPPDAVNGLILAIRLIFIWVGIVVFAIFLPIEYGMFIVVVGDASVIIGLAVGIAIGQAMRNFISGLYVMFSDPFDVGDYIRIGASEGIVLEISMNYTKLRRIDGTTTLIPNNNVMNSAVTNYRFERKRKSKIITDEATAESSSIPRRIWKVISKAIDTSKLIQYSFELKFPVKETIDNYEQILNGVCKKWRPKFGYRPVFALSSMSHVAFTFTFTIFVEDPQALLEYRSDFIEDIGRAIY